MFSIEADRLREASQILDPLMATNPSSFRYWLARKMLAHQRAFDMTARKWLSKRGKGPDSELDALGLALQGSPELKKRFGELAKILNESLAKAKSLAKTKLAMAEVLEKASPGTCRPRWSHTCRRPLGN